MLVYRVPVTAADRAGATDSNCTRIVSIDSLGSLGYASCGREEHSGENVPSEPDDLMELLADNRFGQLAGRHSH